MEIITNNQFRNILYDHELSDTERKEFDYMEDIEQGSFIRYKGLVYDLSEFMLTPQELNELSEWHGYRSDSFFSGVVIRYSDDMEQVVMGTYIS